LHHALVVVPYILARVLAQRALSFARTRALPESVVVEPRLIESDEPEVQPNA
jgi:hypothetical protein